LDRPDKPKYSEEYDKIVKIADAPLQGYARWHSILKNDSTLQVLNQRIIELAERLKL
jgi:hypothetical protein